MNDRLTMWEDSAETGPPTRSREANHVPPTDPHRPRGPLPPRVATGTRGCASGALPRLSGSGRDAVPQPDHRPAAGPGTGAPGPHPRPGTDGTDGLDGADGRDRRVLPPLDRSRDLAPQLADAAARGLITPADVLAVLDAYAGRPRRSWITAPWAGRRITTARRRPR